jgi:histidinol-phosphatase
VSAVADDLALALELADAADEITMPLFRDTGLVIDTKPDMTPVTEADRGVERALRDVLATRRPGDAVLGEEFGSSGTGSRRWIVDPVDGTKNFVRNVPVWATLIGLEDAGAITVGVVSAPALGRRWWAGRGLGAFADGRAIRVSKVESLADAQLSYSSLSGWEEQGGVDSLLRLGEQCWRTRAFGDFWSHVLVAEGAVDVGLDPIVTLWDLAALQVIVEEAGGRFTDFTGKATPDGGSAISTNGLLHETVLDQLRTGGTKGE